MADYKRIFPTDEEREQKPEIYELALFSYIYLPAIHDKISKGQFLDEIFERLANDYRSADKVFDRPGSVHRIRAARVNDYEFESDVEDLDIEFQQLFD